MVQHRNVRFSRNPRLGHSLAVSLGLACGLLSTAASAAPGAAQCRAMAKLKIESVEISGARLVPITPAGTIPLPERGPSDKIESALPQHCRVEGTINRRKGANGKEYGIGFALALPSNWNGRFLFQGGGGFNGRIADPYGMVATGDEPALARGFAIISTDSGHKGATFDTSFIQDQQAALDFAFNAIVQVTHLGKDLTRRYYGTAPHHSYSDGCSTGGREGMTAAQHYPDLFDGIIAGDPAMRSWHTRIAGWNAAVAFNRIAPKDLAGKPLATQAFSAEEHALLAAAVAKQCDVLDGLADGLMLNLPACHFSPRALECKEGEQAGCLGKAKIEALETAFAGPKDSSGNSVYPGFPYELGLLGGRVPMTLIPASFGYTPYTDPPSPFLLDVDAAVDRARADVLETLTDTWEWTNLGSFYRRGGKIIFYHGAADPWYSIYDTLDYFERSKKANPDGDNSRFYSVPGMQHCAGGGLERFDMLTRLVDWVENGKAPEAVVATDWRRKLGTRPLCPWPKYAHFDGTGDPKIAASFSCVAQAEQPES